MKDFTLSKRNKIILSIAIIAAILLPIGLWLRSVNKNSETYAYKETRVISDGNDTDKKYQGKKHETEPETEVKEDEDQKKEENEEDKTEENNQDETPADQLVNKAEENLAYKKVTVDGGNQQAVPVYTNNPAPTTQSSASTSSSSGSGNSTGSGSTSSNNNQSAPVTSQPEVSDSYDEDGKQVYVIMYDKNNDLSEEQIRDLLQGYGVQSDSDITVTDVDEGNNKTSSTTTNTTSDSSKKSSRNTSSGIQKAVSDFVNTVTGKNPSEKFYEDLTPEEKKELYKDAEVKLSGFLNYGKGTLKLIVYGAPQYYVKNTSWHISTISGSPSLNTENAFEAVLLCGEGDECEVYVDVTLESGKQIKTNSKVIRYNAHGEQTMYDTDDKANVTEMEALDGKVSQEGETG